MAGVSFLRRLRNRCYHLRMAKQPTAATTEPRIRMSLFVDADLHERVRIAAAQANVPLWQIVSDTLRRALGTTKKRGTANQR